MLEMFVITLCFSTPLHSCSQATYAYYKYNKLERYLPNPKSIYYRTLIIAGGIVARQEASIPINENFVYKMGLGKTGVVFIKEF